MKLGILGGTRLSVTLGKKYLDSGLDVIFGVRNEFDIQAISWRIYNTFLDNVIDLEEAIENSEVLLICCENVHLKHIVEKLKSTDLEGKILIDCTNSTEYKDLYCNTALIRSQIKDVPLFKAYNNLGIDYPKSEFFGPGKETYFCGETGPEKLKVKRLIELIGYRAIDSGGLENAALLEAFFHLKREITSQKNEPFNFQFQLLPC